VSRSGTRRRRRERYRWRKQHVGKGAARRRRRGQPLAKPTYRTWLRACCAARRLQVTQLLKGRPVPSVGVYPCYQADRAGAPAATRHWHVGWGWRASRRRRRVQLTREAATRSAS
jgi:hypothetical protein